MNILLIDDDPILANLLAAALTEQGWTVTLATDGETGLAWAIAQTYDVIVLDIGLPKLDGIMVCQRLRQQGYPLPILLLTAQDSPDVQVVGLDAGADDYLTKPVDLKILLARVRALARKGKRSPSVLVWDTIQVNGDSGEVRCGDRLVRLTAKELAVLMLFLQNPGHLYSRQAILDRVWSVAAAPGEETVNTHIKCIRQKLKAAGGGDPIETAYGLGYRLRSPQCALAAPPAADLPPESPAIAPDGAAAALPAQKTQAIVGKLWQQFKASYLEQIHTLATTVPTFCPGSVPPERVEMGKLAHKLVGSLGMFGWLVAAKQAKELELLLQTETFAPEHRERAIAIITDLQVLLTAAQTQLPPNLSAVAAAPLPAAASGSAVPPKLPAPVLIVDDDAGWVDRLRIEAIAWNLPVETAMDLSTARQKIAHQAPSVLLLDLNFSGQETGLALLQELEQRSQPIPVIVMTAADDLRDRVAVAKLGVHAFLHKPLPASAVLKSVTDALQRSRQPRRGDRVLLVDDDPAFLSLLAAALTAQGYQVTTLAQPSEFWHILTQCCPDAVVLDWAMPDFDGGELCQVVRTDPQWQHLKILVLSAHDDPLYRSHAFAAGADDYLTKTSAIAALVARIRQRLPLIERFD